MELFVSWSKNKKTKKTEIPKLFDFRSRLSEEAKVTLKLPNAVFTCRRQVETAAEDIYLLSLALEESIYLEPMLQMYRDHRGYAATDGRDRETLAES